MSEIAKNTSKPQLLLKKAVATIALWPMSGSFTYTGKLTYNSMVFLAQGMQGDEEGGFSVAVSQIVKSIGLDTRSSARVTAYIDSMIGQKVQWSPLAEADVIDAYEQIKGEQLQEKIAGLEVVAGEQDEKRIFTLLAEARFFKRSGEMWVTYFFPPTIRAMLLDPNRWALFDLLEQAKLSTYAAATLYEICSRYRDVPGGKTNRASTEWWGSTLRGNADGKAREWRKFKYETLNPAMAEIHARTGLFLELIEHKQGRSITQAQFLIRQDAQKQVTLKKNLDLVELGDQLKVPEIEIDKLVDIYGRELVFEKLNALDGRIKASPLKPIKYPLAYLKKSLKEDNGMQGGLFDPRTSQPEQVSIKKAALTVLKDITEEAEEREKRARMLASKELEKLGEEELKKYAKMAQGRLRSDSPTDQALQKRFNYGQYRSGLIWRHIVEAYAIAVFGSNWVDKLNDIYSNEYE